MQANRLAGETTQIVGREDTRQIVGNRALQALQNHIVLVKPRLNFISNGTLLSFLIPNYNLMNI